MDQFNFAQYCSSFLTDPKKAGQIFYKTQDENFSYKELIQSAVSISHFFKDAPDTFIALQLESSYQLFAHLLAGIMAEKDILILSPKEPDAAVKKYQEQIPFTKVLKTSVSKSFEMAPSINDHDVNNGKKAAFYILSSGSSGPPKGIPLTLSNIYHSALGVIDFFQMTSNDTSFLNLPHHHIGGLMILWRAFFSGGSVTIKDNSSYQFISLVPLQLKRFINDPIKKEQLKYCRGVLIGGAPLEDYLKDLALKNHISIFETYGMSETSSLVLLNGIPLKNQEVKLDQDGHFLIKGKTLSPSVELDPDGFFRTNDIGILNPDGSFSFKHRADLLFKSAGELINPLLIESKVKELPWISEAVVVPIKHSELTKASVLVYTLRAPDKTSLDIKNHLKNLLHPYQIPRYIFMAPADLIQEGIKPRRFDISYWAQKKYFSELFHYLYVPQKNARQLVVFFHGFMEDYTDMIPLMNNDGNSAFLFINLPGHGKGPIECFKDRSNIFIEIKSLINFYSQNLQLVVYGYSMGGRVAIELCMNGLNPKLLILESSHFGIETNEEKIQRLNADKKLFDENQFEGTPFNLEEFFKTWYTNPIFGNYNQSPDFTNEINKKLTHDYRQWLASLHFFSPGATPYLQQAVVDKLKDLKIVAIVGSDDLKYKNHFQKMKTLFSDFNVLEIKNSGHNPHKTHLNEIKKILSAFI